MVSVSPVLTEAEVSAEQVIALDQPEYFPIIVLRVVFNDKDASVATYTRFRFSPEERAAIANGADLLLSQPHHGSLMPIALQLAKDGCYPQEQA